MRKLDDAMELKENPEYIALLDEQARHNQWAEKAKAIVDMLRRYES